MSSNEDNSTEMVSEMLQKLSIANDAEKKELLNEARPYLLAPDAPTKFKRQLENENWSTLFGCLNSKDKHVLSSTCDILSRLFQFVDPSLISEKYADCLEKSLNHSTSEVKEVTLVFLNRCLTNQDFAHETLLSNKKLVSTLLYKFPRENFSFILVKNFFIGLPTCQ